jgi:predicted ATP-grasp superfamily ATP-dependent carboligase
VQAVKRALVVDPRGERTSVAALRGLAAAGWSVGVAGPRGRGAAASRHCWRVHAVPGPEWGLTAFRDALNRAVVEGGYEVLLPSGDAEVLALAELRDELGAVVPYPNAAAVRRAHDKLDLAAAAQEAGLRAPRTVLATGDLHPRTFGDAVMVKARVHAAPRSPGDPLRFEAARATTPAEVAARVGQLRAAGREAVVQEIVDGALLGFVAVGDGQGRLRGTVQQVASRVWPSSGGLIARAQTVPVDPVLAAGVARLLRGLGWTGLAMLEFVVPADGAPRLIDFNGRFYASIALALRAGVNLPAMWAAHATSRPFAGPDTARAGVRFQWLEGDLRLAVQRRGPAMLGEAVAALRYGVGAGHSQWLLSDPGPALRRAREVVATDGRRVPRLLRQVSPTRASAPD